MSRLRWTGPFSSFMELNLSQRLQWHCRCSRERTRLFRKCAWDMVGTHDDLIRTITLVMMGQTGGTRERILRDKQPMELMFSRTVDYVARVLCKYYCISVYDIVSNYVLYDFCLHVK